MKINLALMLHVFGVVIWVGGMFFAYMALRPAAAKSLEPSSRLQLWESVFKLFFPWVWLSIVLILGSGYYVVFALLGGFAKIGVYIHIMHGLGIVMTLLFLHVYFAPFKRLKKAVAAKDWERGGAALSQIRLLIAINLSMGILVVLVATAGRHFLP